MSWILFIQIFILIVVVGAILVAIADAVFGEKEPRMKHPEIVPSKEPYLLFPPKSPED